MSYSIEELAAMIRDDGVHRAVYTDPEIFELEMKLIEGTGQRAGVENVMAALEKLDVLNK